MADIKNSEILKNVLQTLYTVTSTRTTETSTAMVMSAIIKTIEQKYGFLKYVKIKEGGHSEHGDDVIDIASDLESVDTNNICKAIETIVKVVYSDLGDKAGLFFIKEIRRRTEESIISKLKDHGVDLEFMELEQHYFKARQVNKKPTGASVAGDETKGKEEEQQDDVSLLGNKLENISSRKYNSDSKICVIPDEDGKKSNTLNPNTINKGYVNDITGEEDLSDDYETGEIQISEKDYELLEVLHSRDMDAETALALLHISMEELESMIHRLIKIEMLHYSSTDEVELTESGINQLLKKENNDKKKIDH